MSWEWGENAGREAYLQRQGKIGKMNENWTESVQSLPFMDEVTESPRG